MNKFIFFFFLLIVPLFIYAQKFNGGISAGFVASQLDGDTYGGYHKAGFEVGTFVNRYITKNTSLQMQLKYIQKGSRHIPDSIDFENRPYRLHMDYVEIPFNFNYHYKKRFVISLGIHNGYLFNFKEELDYIRLYEDEFRYFNKYELSYSVGLSYKISKKIIFGILHNYSILPVRKHALGSVYKFNFGQYNKLLAFSFYYQFNNESR